MTAIAPEIFKAYDIRGIVDKTLTEEAAEAIGRGLGTSGKRKGVGRFVIGRDGRLSGPRLSRALAKGLNAAGIDVIDIGVVATPMVYFATHHFKTGSGVMVTGSHNPPDYNGLKMMIAGDTLSGEAIQELRKLIERGDFASGAGKVETADVSQHYLDRITSDVKLARPMTIAVDCGNGSPGAFVPELYKRLGCKVIELFCEVDGTFPNHHPDPTVEDKGAAVDPDFAVGRAAVEAKDWPAAIRALSSAALRDTRNADIQNYLGYAYRHTGQLDLAFKHYERALQLNPRHRGAHEYAGEAYLMVNDLAKAEEHLGALQTICLIPCEEYEDLKKAIADYRRKAAK